MLLSADIARLARRIHFQLVEAASPTTLAAASAGRGAIVSESLSLIRGLHLGDTIEIGPARLPIVGVHVDYSDQQGSVLIDRSVLHRALEGRDGRRLPRLPETRRAPRRRTASDPRPLRRPRPPVRPPHRRGEELRPRHRRPVVRPDVRSAFDRGPGGGSRHRQQPHRLRVDRRRELGVVQAVGGLPWQVRRAVWLESAVIGAAGVVLGVALGAVALWFNLRIMRVDSLGYRRDYTFPAGFAALLVPVMLGAALVPALGPAEAAVRGSLVEALEYE